MVTQHGIHQYIVAHASTDYPVKILDRGAATLLLLFATCCRKDYAHEILFNASYKGAHLAKAVSVSVRKSTAKAACESARSPWGLTSPALHALLSRKQLSHNPKRASAILCHNRMKVARRSHGTAGYLSVGPTAQCVVHALKGLACRARVTSATSPASHCKQCSALTLPSLHACGCASPSRAR